MSSTFSGTVFLRCNQNEYGEDGYFDNDIKVKAPFDAKRLIEKLGLADGLVPFTWQGEPTLPPPNPAARRFLFRRSSTKTPARRGKTAKSPRAGHVSARGEATVGKTK